MNNNLDRFIEAQKRDYKIALSEIKDGKKRNHWMWYIFPQLKDLGFSSTAKYYGIDGIQEAREYLSNEYLKNNLLEICNALLILNSNDARKILGYPDDLKLKSSMTLFNYVDPNENVFKKVLEKFFDGEVDNITIELLEK